MTGQAGVNEDGDANNPSDGRRDRLASSRVNAGRKRGTGTTAEWAEADPRKLAWAIDAVSNRGGCLRLGRTRDGGAYAIGVYLGDEYFTDYVRPDEDLDDYLEDLVVWAQQQPQVEAPVKQKSIAGRNKAVRNSQGR